MYKVKRIELLIILFEDLLSAKFARKFFHVVGATGGSGAVVGWGWCYQTPPVRGSAVNTVVTV